MAETIIFTSENPIAFVFNEDFGHVGLIEKPGFSLKPGNNYKVSWDETEWSVNAYNATIPGVGDFVAVGNGADLGYPGNSEPFVIAWNSNVVIFFAFDDPKETHEIIIAEKEIQTGIIVKDRTGADKEYIGANGIRVRTLDGSTKEFIDPTNVPEPVETNVQPDFSNGNMEVLPNKDEVFSKITIEKPTTLIPEHISKGVNIAGVTGTLKAGGEVAKSKAINFYDIYGNIIYSYTRGEFAALTELPKAPEVPGYNFVSWSWTLDNLKSAPFADVGAQYRKEGSVATALLVTDVQKDLTLPVYFNPSYKGTVYIDWGDGTQSSLATSNTSHNTTQYTLSHTYTITGIVVIGIWFVPTDRTHGSIYLGKYSTSASSSRFGIFGGSANGYRRNLLAFTGSNAYPGSAALYQEYSLKYYCTNSGSYDYYSPYQCYALETVAFKDISIDNTHYGQCYSIKRLATGNNLPSGALGGLHGLQDLSVTSGIYNSAIAAKNLIITSTSVVTLNVSLYFGSNLERVYVPDNLVDSYKSNSKWSAYAKYIYPLSEYPDY